MRIHGSMDPVFTVNTKEVAGKSTLPLFSSFSRILSQKWWSVARFQAFGNSSADPPDQAHPADPADALESAATTKGGGLRPPPFVVSFVLALDEAHFLALNTAHVLRLNKADVLALNKAHVLRLNTKTCPVFTANTKETTKGGGRRPPPLCGGGRRPPPLCWL